MDNATQNGNQSAPLEPSQKAAVTIAALRLKKWMKRKRDRSRTGSPKRPKLASAASSVGSGIDAQQEPPVAQSAPVAQSLWDRAYDALRMENQTLVDKYEKLLSREEPTATSSSHGESLAETNDRGGQPRQRQLDAVIAQGLRRLEENKTKYTIAGHEFVPREQIAKAAEFVLWAKSWIGEAVKASPEASLVWAGVCLVLPLLTKPATSEEANRDGFMFVTSKMRYYVALEPLLLRLSQNPGVAGDLTAEANSQLVVLYQHIIAFQIQSVLRFYAGSLKNFAADAVLPKDWKSMQEKIGQLEKAVNQNLMQMNQLVARQELESLDKTARDTLAAMQRFLYVSEQQLRVQEDHRDISRDALQTLNSIQKQKLSDEEEKCLQLFRLTDSTRDATYEWYKDRVEKRVQDTCQWFLKHNHFQQWLKQESGPLLVSADPGCGKSVLAKYLIDDVLPRPTNATICYFFFKDQDQNTVRQALCALLHQLLSKKPYLVEWAMEPYKKNGSGLINSTRSLWTILEKAIQDPRTGPVIFVLDALDECAEPEFKDLVETVTDQFSRKRPGFESVRYLFTSRPYEEIVSKFRRLLSSFPNIRIPGEDESEMISKEINCVITHRVDELSTEMRLSPKVKNHLEARLRAVEHRTYLWLYLVFDHLETGFKHTQRGVEEAIETLPENVNQAYERILNKSKGNPMVRKSLSIILAARRPLKISEMNVAVNIQDQSQPFDAIDLEDEENFTARLRSWCGLFVSVHHGKVYFLHQTAREFLTASPSPTAASPGTGLRWQNSITAQQAQAVIAELCVLYLDKLNDSDVELPTDSDSDADFPTDSDSDAELPTDSDSDAELLTDSSLDNNRVAFLHYAAENWGDHFYNAGLGLVDDATVQIAARISGADSKSRSIWTKIYDKLDDDIPRPFAGLQVASYFGLEAVAQLLLDQGADVTQNNSGEMPFATAASRGHVAVVRLLLDRGAAVNAKDYDGWTPLIYAAKSENVATARLLLDNGADVNTSSNDGFTPLMNAAHYGREAVVQLLLDRGAAVNAVDNNGMTPLLYTADNESVATARLLLDRGADVNTPYISGRSPLIVATIEGREAAVRLLLDRGAAVDAVDSNSTTALIFAARLGHEAVVRRLLDQGADINVVNKNGDTALFSAVQNGHEAIVQLLLDQGADINVVNKNGDTAFFSAAKNGHEAIVQLLLDQGADINVVNKNGDTALSLAAYAYNVHEAVIRLLLKNNADVNVVNKFNSTALSNAVKNGREAIVRLLLENGADVNVVHYNNDTALSLAAENGHEAIVRLLLEKGAAVNVVNKGGYTALFYAAYYGNEAMVRLLLENGADVNVVNNKGDTALSIAVEKGHEAVEELLRSYA